MAIFQRTLTATAAAATVFAALALPVWAQAPAPATPAATTSTTADTATRTTHGEGQRHHQRDHQAHGKRMAEKAQKFQAALQLTDAQQAGWTTYREALKPAPRAERMDRANFAKLTTPQRLDHMQQQRAQRNAEADRRAEATKAFYATLSPAQQKTFDAQSLRHGKHAGKHRGHHGHHGKPGQGAQPGTATPAAASPAK